MDTLRCTNWILIPSWIVLLGTFGGCNESASILPTNASVAGDASTDSTVSVNLSPFSGAGPIELRIEEIGVGLETIQIEANENKKICLQSITAFGNGPLNIKRELRLTNISESPIQIIGFETSCGCSKVETSTRAIPTQGVAELKIEYDINPKFSGPNKTVSVSMLLSDGRSLSIVANIFVYPTVRVAGVNQNRAVLDAGDCLVNVDKPTGKFSTEIGVDVVGPNEFALCSENLIRSLEIQPANYQVRMIRTDSPSKIVETEASNMLLFRRRCFIEVSGVFDSIASVDSTNQVTISLVCFDEINTIFASLRKVGAIVAKPETIVFKKRQTNAKVVLTPTDGTTRLALVKNIQYDEKFLTVKSIQGLGTEGQEYEIELTNLPIDRFKKFEIRFCVGDDEFTCVKVVCISPF